MINGIPVVLGTDEFGTTIGEKQAYAVLDQYADLGGRCVDTANNYAFWHGDGAGGESEAVIGRWLEKRYRSDFTVMSKVGSQPLNTAEDPGVTEGLSAAAIRNAVEKSMQRLCTGRLDILLAHHDDPRTPLLETWVTFSELVFEGKVGAVGISNYLPHRIEELAGIIREHNLAPIGAIQQKYSLLDFVTEPDPTHPPLDKAGLKTIKQLLPEAALFAYSPLLSGRIYEAPPDGKWPVEYDSAENRVRVRAYRERAVEMGVSTSAYVLSEIVKQGIFPVTGTSKVERLKSNLSLLTG